jgi:hypothetical protein
VRDKIGIRDKMVQDNIFFSHFTLPMQMSAMAMVLAEGG